MEQMEPQLLQSKKNRRKIHATLRIDMTPMVDLGFLLITFFILTTAMSEKKAMRLIMPDDKDSSVLGESNVLSVLLGPYNQVYAYEGRFEEALSIGKIISTNYAEGDGIGKLIRQKQKQMQQSPKQNGKNALVFLIKPSVSCTYKNVIDALDETAINDVSKYMIVDASAEEKQFLENNNRSLKQ